MVPNAPSQEKLSERGEQALMAFIGAMLFLLKCLFSSERNASNTQPILSCFTGKDSV